MIQSLANTIFVTLLQQIYLSDLAESPNLVNYNKNASPQAIEATGTKSQCKN